MAKRHYSSHKMDGGHMMKAKGPHSGRPEQMYANEFYAGAANRYRQEFEDGGMIEEDDRAIANLPQEVMMKAYPKVGDYLPEEINDGISGIDERMYADNRKRKMHTRPSKA
jgi:hypothetical protein